MGVGIAAFPFLAAMVGSVLLGRERPSVRDYDPLPPGDTPPVSVIVPARNEAANIAACLESILASTYPALDVIVVDDRSTDGTGEAARALAAREPRLRVIAGDELPEGWYGKPWACWQGRRAASGSVLCFTDADARHGPALLGHAVAMLRRERADLVSLMPRQVMRGFWEAVAQPFFFILLGLRFGSAARINRSTSPRDAIANGQFIMVTRESYDAVGGHRAVAGTVIEDIMLARVYREAGRRHFFAFALDDLTVRMYTSLAGILEGWGKNLFAGVLSTVRSRPLAYLAAAGMLLFPLLWLLPLTALAIGLAAAMPVLTGYGLAAHAFNVLVFGVALAKHRNRAGWALCYPVGALLQVLIILRAMMRGTRRIEWKGRTYAHG